MNKYNSPLPPLISINQKYVLYNHIQYNHKVWNTILSKYKYNEITSLLTRLLQKPKYPYLPLDLIPALPEIFFP